MSTPVTLSAPAPPAISIDRLPVTSRDLFGREPELAWLDACWERGVRVACVVARGGAGKSALVNAWLRAMAEAGWRGAERVLGWSFHGQETDRLGASDAFVETALRWLGDADPRAGAPWDKGERLAGLVRKQRTILVLDGVEALQRGPLAAPGKLRDPALETLLAALAAENGGLCVVTSRLAVKDLEALAADGRVEPRALDPLSAEAGAALLEARGVKGPREELTAAAREYEGHALALALLGSYLRRACHGDVRKRDGIPPHAGGPAQRMMAAFEKWFARKPEIAVLRTLSLFDRPAPEDEIAAVRATPRIRALTTFLDGPPKPPPHAWEKAVATLRDVGLVAPAPEGAPGEGAAGAALEASPLVRAYFAELLRRDHPDAWREGHQRLFVRLQAKGKERPETIEEMAVLYAAVVHGCLAENKDTTNDPLNVLWRRVSRIHDNYNWQTLRAYGSELALFSTWFEAPWERFAPWISQTTRVFLVNRVAPSLGAVGRLPEAVALLRMGLERSFATKDWRNAGQTAATLSELQKAHGDLRDAVEQARKGVELAEKSDDPHQRRICQATLGAALHAAGHRDEAAACFDQAEQLAKEFDAAHPLLRALPGFLHGDLLLDQRRDADTRKRAERLVAWHTPNDAPVDIAFDHLSLGRALLLAAQTGAGGDPALAAAHLTSAADTFRLTGRYDYLPLGLLARAALHTHTRAFPLARTDLDEALSLATRLGLRLHECDAHLGHARLAMAEGDAASARAHLDAGRAIVAATGYHRRDAELAELAGRLA